MMRIASVIAALIGLCYGVWRFWPISLWWVTGAVVLLVVIFMATRKSQTAPTRPHVDGHGEHNTPASVATHNHAPAAHESGGNGCLGQVMSAIVTLALLSMGGGCTYTFYRWVTDRPVPSAQVEATATPLSACEIDSRAVRYPYGPDGCVSKHLGWARWWPVDGPMSVHYPEGKGSHVEDLCKPGPPLTLHPGTFRFCRNSPNSWGVAILER